MLFADWQTVGFDEGHNSPHDEFTNILSIYLSRLTGT